MLLLQIATEMLLILWCVHASRKYCILLLLYRFIVACRFLFFLFRVANWFLNACRLRKFEDSFFDFVCMLPDACMFVCFPENKMHAEIFMMQMISRLLFWRVIGNTWFTFHVWGDFALQFLKKIQTVWFGFEGNRGFSFNLRENRICFLFWKKKICRFHGWRSS
jgi:hypothetical protein